MKPPHSPFVASVLALAASSTLHAQTWDGNGSPNAGGTWSTALNWTTDTVPTTGNTAVLDTTGANRTVIYDAAASGALGTLTFNQSSAFSNILDFQRSATVNNAIVLGAASGTERISFNTGNTPTANIALTATGGITLNAGGELELAAYRQAGTSGTNGTVSQTDITGGVTVSGGILTVRDTDNNAAPFASGSASNTISGSLTMSSGSLVIGNNIGVADRRLSVNGTVNITGGAISSNRLGAGGTLTFNSANNSLSPTSFDTDISITLGSSGAQALSSTVNMGGLTARGTGIKTVTNSGTIGQIQLMDGDSTSGSKTTLRLGSNLTLSSNATQLAAQNFGNSHEAGVINLAVDTNGFTLDLSTGGSSGVWTPNLGGQSGVTSAVWDISGAGAVRANAFVFTGTSVTTNVASGTTLTASGGNSTASNLGGTGTIDANSTFRYSGTAATATPATVTSNRNLGDIEVSSGALRMLTGSTGTAQDLRVSGGTFDLDAKTDRTFTTISLTGGTLANGTFATTEAHFTGLSTGTVSGNLTGTLKELRKTTAGTLTLSGSGNTYNGATIVSAGTLVLGHSNALGNTSNLQITGGTLDLGGFTVNKFINALSNGGTLSNGTINRTSNTSFTLASGTVSVNFTDTGGVLSFIKNTAGTVTFSGINSYDGTTAVTAGKLLINGNNSAALGAVTVSTNATLGGIGSVGGSVTVDSSGIIAPGVTAGNLTLTNGLDLNGIFAWDLGSLSTANPGTDFDILTVTGGSVDITGASLGLNLGANAPSAIPFWQMDQTWNGILNNIGLGSLTGAFAAIDNSAWASIGSFTTTNSGNDVNLVWSAVPEPSSFSLIGGLGVLALLRRRR